MNGSEGGLAGSLQGVQDIQERDQVRFFGGS
jgi:hypothetical protein